MASNLSQGFPLTFGDFQGFSLTAGELHPWLPADALPGLKNPNVMQNTRMFKPWKGVGL